MNRSLLPIHLRGPFIGVIAREDVPYLRVAFNSVRPGDLGPTLGGVVAQVSNVMESELFDYDAERARVFTLLVEAVIRYSTLVWDSCTDCYILAIEVAVVVPVNSLAAQRVRPDATRVTTIHPSFSCRFHDVCPTVKGLIEHSANVIHCHSKWACCRAKTDCWPLGHHARRARFDDLNPASSKDEVTPTVGAVQGLDGEEIVLGSSYPLRSRHSRPQVAITGEETESDEDDVKVKTEPSGLPTTTAIGHTMVGWA